MEKTNYARFWRKNMFCCIVKKMKLKGNWYRKFNFLFLFFSHLTKIWYAKGKALPSNRKNIFYGNLHHPIQDRLSLLISKSIWHNFPGKAFKNQCFSGCTDTFMAYTSFPVHGHIQEFIKEFINSALMPP